MAPKPKPSRECKALAVVVGVMGVLAFICMILAIASVALNHD